MLGSVRVHSCVRVQVQSCVNMFLARKRQFGRDFEMSIEGGGFRVGPPSAPPLKPSRVHAHAWYQYVYIDIHSTGFQKMRLSHRVEE